MKKVKLGSKVHAKWLDAAGGQKVDKETVSNVSPKSLLVITDTFGILYKEDNLAILILQEDSNEQCDYTVIPKGMLVSLKELK
jgi:hypothetical protein